MSGRGSTKGIREPSVAGLVDMTCSRRTAHSMMSCRCQALSDPVLAALLTEVSLGDQLAGRVVLQALIGRMVRMAQRDPRASYR